MESVKDERQVMKIFLIGDLHLSLSSGKPMDVFGDHWNDHHHLIEKNLKELITENDLLLPRE